MPHKIREDFQLNKIQQKAGTIITERLFVLNQRHYQNSLLLGRNTQLADKRAPNTESGESSPHNKTTQFSFPCATMTAKAAAKSVTNTSTFPVTVFTGPRYTGKSSCL